MNGRVSKLLRKVFDSKSERRRFHKAYSSAPGKQKAEVRKMANKIKDARGKGQKIQTFRVKPGTHEIEPTKGDNDG